MQLRKVFEKSATGNWIAAISLAASLLFGTVTLYWTRQPKASMTYEVLSASSVIDVNESIPKLGIVYDGRPIGGALRLITMRILNDGETTIRTSDFDAESPCGVRLANGVFIDSPKAVGARDESLQEQFGGRLLGSDRAVFSPLMLNPGDFIEIKVLAILSGEDRPILSPVGRLAGVPAILLRGNDPPAPSVVWKFGKIALWTGIVGLPLLVLLFRRRILRVLLLLDAISRQKQWHKRLEEEFAAFKGARRYILDPAEQWVFDEALNFGGMYPLMILDLLRQPGRIPAAEQYIAAIDRGERPESQPGHEVLDAVGFRGISRGREQGLTDQAMRESLERFVNFDKEWNARSNATAA